MVQVVQGCLDLRPAVNTSSLHQVDGKQRQGSYHDSALIISGWLRTCKTAGS